MSMNLHCEEMDLWQTPGFITYMCYSSDDDTWQGILGRYKIWVKSHTDGVWPDLQDYENMKENVRDHIATLDAVVEQHGSLSFYIM